VTKHPNNPRVLLTQGDQVYASFDAGETWGPRGPSGSNVKGAVRRVVIQPSTSAWVAGTTQGQIWLSGSSGASWNLIGEHPDRATVVSMAFSPADDHVLYVLFSGGQHYRRIARFQNVGVGGLTLSWITHNFPMDCPPSVIAGDARSSDIAYVGVDEDATPQPGTSVSGGVFRWDASKPTYDRWAPYNNGLPLARVTDLLVDPQSGELRAATHGRGAWSVSIDSTIGTRFLAQGRVNFLRINEVSEGYGPPSDFLDAEVIITLDTEPGKAFGLQLRDDEDAADHRGMFDLLREAFKDDSPVNIVYLKTGRKNGSIERVSIP